MIIERGKKYGFWKVIEPAGMASKGRHRYVCQCECGRIENVTDQTLLNEKTQGCVSCRAKKTNFFWYRKTRKE